MCYIYIITTNNKLSKTLTDIFFFVFFSFSFSLLLFLCTVIQRDAKSIMWNYATSLATIDILALLSYGIAPIDLADRASIVFTMVLTVMAFKFVLADKLPSGKNNSDDLHFEI